MKRWLLQGVLIALLLIVATSSSLSVTVDPLEEKLKKEGSLDVIVFLKEDVPVNKITIKQSVNAQALMQLKHKQVREDVLNSLSVATDAFDPKVHEFKQKHSFDMLNGFSGTVSLEGYQKLKHDDRIEAILLNEIIYLDPIVSNGPFVQLADSVPFIGATYAQNVLNLTGQGVKIAVLDTGIDLDHVEFGNCSYMANSSCTVIGGYDFVNNDNNSDDDNGHGSHVAGIIAANGTLTGVAPGATLYSVKVCTATGGCSTSAILSGIEYAVTNLSADIISMSLGGHSLSSPNLGLSSISLAAQSAVDQGVVVVAAAGNDGTAEGAISYPADAHSVITVGSMSDSTVTISSFSNRGPSALNRVDPDVVAPGSSIYSSYVNGGYSTLSGTSMATPHVSGVVALMLEYDPSLTPLDIRRKLMHTATNMSGHTYQKGAGYINVSRAVTDLVDIYVMNRDRTDDDRWEFSFTGHNVSTTLRVENTYSHALNFSVFVEAPTMYGTSTIINTSGFFYPSSFVVGATSNFTLNVSFYQNSFSPVGFYGGALVLRSNDSLDYRIPLSVSMPFHLNGSDTKTAEYECKQCSLNSEYSPSATEFGDWFIYELSTLLSGAWFATLSWAGLHDFDFYVYNSTGSLIMSDAGFDNPELINVTNSSLDAYWFAIHAFEFDTVSSVPYTLNVTYLNKPPVFTALSNYTLYENQTLVINFSATDFENDTLTYSTNLTVGFINTSDNTFVFVTNESSSGVYNARFSVSDGITQVNQSVVITVLNLNAVPVLNFSGTTTVFENETLTLQINATDLNNDSLVLFTNSTVGVFNTTTGVFVWDTNFTSSGEYALFFFADDAQDNGTLQVNVTVTDVNLVSAWIQPQNVTMEEDSTLLIYINITNYDSDTVLYLINDSTLTHNNQTGLINYTPTFNYYGLRWYELNITDGINSTIYEFYVNVTPVNDAPVLMFKGNTTYNVGQLVNISLNATDVDSSNITYSTSFSYGSLNGTTGLFTWQTNSTQNGTHALTFYANDSQLVSSLIVNITLLPLFDLDSDGMPDLYDSDDDGDGVNDSIDSVYGTVNQTNISVFSNVTLLYNLINVNNLNSSQLTGVLNVSFYESNQTRIMFEHNFSAFKLDLIQIATFKKQLDNATKGYQLIKGLNITGKKVFYVDRVAQLSSVCIKDAEIDSIDNVTLACNATNEYYVACNGLLNQSYNCSVAGSYFRIEGLSHSAVLESCIDMDQDGYCADQGTLDCNDNASSVHPGATEVCGDLIDNDCSGGDLTCPVISNSGSSSNSGSGGSIVYDITSDEEEPYRDLEVNTSGSSSKTNTTSNTTSVIGSQTTSTLDDDSLLDSWVYELEYYDPGDEIQDENQSKVFLMYITILIFALLLVLGAVGLFIYQRMHKKPTETQTHLNDTQK